MQWEEYVQRLPGYGFWSFWKREKEPGMAHEGNAGNGTENRGMGNGEQGTGAMED